MIYLLHFPRRYRHAGHYCGWTGKGELDNRLARHLSGAGSPLIRAVVGQEGITTLAEIKSWVARTWDGDRYLERKLKNRGGLARVCPICRGESNDGHQGEGQEAEAACGVSRWAGIG